MPALACRRCGCLAVTWMRTKAGKWYLARRTLDTGSMDSADLSYAAKANRRPHDCGEHNRRHDPAREAFLSA